VSSLPQDSYREVPCVTFHFPAYTHSKYALSFRDEASAALFVTFWMQDSGQA